MNFPELHELVDEMVSKMKVASAEGGNPITCKGSGCFGCCKEPVMSTREEAAYVIGALTEEQLEYAKTKMRHWLAQVQASGLLAMKEPKVWYWRDLNAWCPLLRDGKCMVYERRPYGCRMHLAIRDPALCHDDALRMTQRYCQSPEVEMRMSSEVIATLLEQGNGEVTYDNFGLWLAELLLGRKLKSGGRKTYRGYLSDEGKTLNLTRA